MYLRALLPWEHMYNNVLNPVEVYFLVTAVALQNVHYTGNWKIFLSIEIFIKLYMHFFLTLCPWLSHGMVDLRAISYMVLVILSFTWNIVCIAEWSMYQSLCPYIRRFRNKCEIVEEPNSSSKNGIRVKFFSLITGNLVFWWRYEPIRKVRWFLLSLVWLPK